MQINPAFSFSMSGGADDLNKKISSVLYTKGAQAVWDFDSVKQLMSGRRGVRVDLDAKIEATKKAHKRKNAVADAEDEEENSDNDGLENENVSDVSDAESMADNEDVDTEMLQDMPVPKGSASDDDEPVDRVMEKRKAEFFEEADDLVEDVGDTTDESGPKTFTEMNLSRPIMKALADVGFASPTRIQQLAIPLALGGKDICGAASTGSGKTAAFLLPILERLLYKPKSIAATRVLILTPTRELAAQCHSVAVKLAKYTDLSFCLCVGGMSNQQQETELRKHPDVVIATPGRLIDHVQNAASFGLDSIEILVMDEADRMLEEGFQAELQEIIKDCPRSRQTLLFSATMTDNVDKLISLSLKRPVRLFADSTRAVASKLIQEFIRVRPSGSDTVKADASHPKNAHMDMVTLSQREAILLALCMRTCRQRCLIFFPSKSLCHRFRIAFGLVGMKAAELHGNLSQLQRIESLELFRDAKVDFLLCTDLAARGLDIAGVETVINFQMPPSYDRYVHRVGRTARNQCSGRSVTLVGEKERKMVKMVLKNLKPGQVAKQRVIPVEVIKKYRNRIDELEPQISQVLREEREEKAIQKTEMELHKAENLMNHAEEIYSRPARSWFQTEKERQAAKKAGCISTSKSGAAASAEDDEEPIELVEDEDTALIDKEIKKALTATVKQRGPHAGLTRKQKRRKMAELGVTKEELEKTLKSQKVVARAAKRDHRSGATADAKKNNGKGGKARSKKLKTGFSTDMGSGRRRK